MKCCVSTDVGTWTCRDELINFEPGTGLLTSISYLYIDAALLYVTDTTAANRCSYRLLCNDTHNIIYCGGKTYHHT